MPKQRLKCHRRNDRHAISMSPTAMAQTSQFREDVPFASSQREKQKEKLHQRHQTQLDWATDWENVSNRASSHGSQGGLLCVDSNNGWLSQTTQSQSEEIRPMLLSVKSKFTSLPGGDAFVSMKNGLMELYSDNVARRDYILKELRELLRQREGFSKKFNSIREEDQETTKSRSERWNQSWLQTEMDHLQYELEFKFQVSEILRALLLKTKAQKARVKSISDFNTVLQSGIRAFESEESFDVQMNEIREMENEIVDLESHLKLLNDALEDEKQENYKLAQDNAVLRKQVEETTKKGKRKA